jgi:putative hydrolase of the HAD superfamily
MSVRYEAVIFDLFGTLVPTFFSRSYAESLREIAGVLSAPYEDFERAWTDTYEQRSTGDFPTIAENLQHILAELGLPVDRGRIAEAERLRHEFIRQALIPRPEATGVLTEIRARGLKTGLISDCSPDVPLLWGGTTLAPLLDAVVFSAVARTRKPDPRMYFLACEKLAVAPDRCVYVGDGGNNELAGASGVGMSAVLIRVPGEDTPEAYRHEAMEWNGPWIPGLRDILEFLG